MKSPPSDQNNGPDDPRYSDGTPLVFGYSAENPKVGVEHSSFGEIELMARATKDAPIGVLSSVPVRILTAMRFVNLIIDAQTPSLGEHGAIDETVRRLNKKEQAAYDSAIELLRLYFAGEVNCGDFPANNAIMPPSEKSDGKS